jgi:hypothetical protein
MADSEKENMDTGEGIGSGTKMCKNSACKKSFVPKHHGNEQYCNTVCKALANYSNSKSRSNSIDSSKRKRGESANSANPLELKSKEELIDIILDLHQINDNLVKIAQESQADLVKANEELISVKVQIANGILEQFSNKDKGSLGPQKAESGSYSTAAKRSVLVAKLAPEQDASVISQQSLDQFFKSNKEFPALQHCSKRDDKTVVLRFGNEKDMAKAKQILIEKSGIKVASIEEKRGRYPVVVYSTGIEELEKIKTELEYRNGTLKGQITGIRILSKNKGHIKIYVASKECQGAILKEGEVFTKLKESEDFTRHHVVPMNLDFEVTRCFKCQKYGHMSNQCSNKDPNFNCCGRCSQPHRTNTCLVPDSALNCANCGLKHKAGDPACSHQKKAVEKLSKHLCK